jgi:hypothetical protein
VPKFRTLNEVRESCTAQGLFNNVAEVNLDKIRSLTENSEIMLHSAQIIARSLTKESAEWMSVFTLHYDALRTLSEAALLFDKIESVNHQCIFAAVCSRYLELDWNFFEKVRTKRNGINYYGERADFDYWKAVELQMGLYLKMLREEISKSLKQD